MSILGRTGEPPRGAIRPAGVQGIEQNDYWFKDVILQCGMYRHFQTEGLKAIGVAVKRQATLLGQAPRDFRTFASETARLWTGAQAGA